MLVAGQPEQGTTDQRSGSEIERKLSIESRQSFRFSFTLVLMERAEVDKRHGKQSRLEDQLLRLTILELKNGSQRLVPAHNQIERARESFRVEFAFQTYRKRNVVRRILRIELIE